MVRSVCECGKIHNNLQIPIVCECGKQRQIQNEPIKRIWIPFLSFFNVIWDHFKQ